MTEQMMDAHWDRVNAEAVRFARLEYKRRQAVRCIAALKDDAIPATINEQAIRVLSTYRDELSRTTDPDRAPEEYSGARMCRIIDAVHHAEKIRRALPVQSQNDQLLSDLLTAALPFLRDIGSQLADCIKIE